MSAEVACRRAARLLSAAQDRALSAEEAELLQRHLAECLMCRNYRSQLEFLRRAARRFHGEG